MFSSSHKSHCSGNQAKSVLLAPAGIKCDTGIASPGGKGAAFAEVFYSTSVFNSCYSSYITNGSFFYYCSFFY